VARVESRQAANRTTVKSISDQEPVRASLDVQSG
jgi:hypothetical protein